MRMESTFSMSSRGSAIPKTESTTSASGGTYASKHIPEHKPEAAFEKQRGRAKGRGAGKCKYELENTSPEGEGPGVEVQSSADEGGPSRKRRRSRKGLDKKFECPAENCGKVYSRAEHLNRHQLNHSTSVIFRCDQVDCTRSFVRQDLCNRHKERHQSRGKGSQLGRKDSAMYNPSPTVNGRKPEVPRRSISPENVKIEVEELSKPTSQGHFTSPPENASDPFSPTATSSTEASNTPTSNWFPRSNDDQNGPPRHEFSLQSDYPIQGQNEVKPNFITYQHHTNLNNAHPSLNGAFMASPPRPETTQFGLEGMGSLSQTSPFLNGHSNYNSNAAPLHHSVLQNSTESSFSQPSYYPAVPFTLNAGPGQSSQPGGFDSSYSMPPSTHSTPVGFQPYPVSDSQWNAAYTDPAYEGMSNAYLPMLFGGGDWGYERSPNPNSADGLINMMMVGPDNCLSLDGSTSQPLGTYSEIPAQFQHQWKAAQESQGGLQTTMAVHTILQPKLREHRISDSRAQELFKFISEKFNESEESAISPLKSQLINGDRNLDSHMLSTKRMQDYIERYFDQFHPQIPLLHQPTFAADETPNLLLIAMMAIGASCLDRRHDHDLSRNGANLANFLAWHLRSEAFNHKEFRPPGSLWIFQTLLLLELYEKMYSDRILHERAHLHHNTTITLMRRGCSLTGMEPGNQSPSRISGKDIPHVNPVTDHPWWNEWITKESIHRAAYVAFLIDVTHAVMFGHSLFMMVTELKLPLPCDEKIWAASTPAEAFRLWTMLQSDTKNGRPFLEGIYKVWQGKEEVKTDTFGRTILMAGLLFLLWHVKQREQQNQDLRVTATDNRWDWALWNEQLSKAFDNWSSQFDVSLANIRQRPYHHKEELVCESRSVLHHLAHMAMHIDIKECQIYARASQLLGRTISKNDLAIVTRGWQYKYKKKGTQHAVYYALGFLHSVLMPTARTAKSNAYRNHHHQYRARDDPLLNRPWVLYYAALVVWCFSYAKESELQPSRQHRSQQIPLAQSPQDQELQMQQYLRKFYQPDIFAHDPGYLGKMQGLSENNGLLMIVSACFEDCRWELLQEAQKLLSNCIRLNAGRNISIS